ncbi:EthD family reductase [Nocardia sp. CA-151230]|uniref:EthD family reductase n=1 Tax=Nocardia sp. CA-151230 TaxID=3239982 RepID=UPI003D93D859
MPCGLASAPMVTPSSTPKPMSCWPGRSPASPGHCSPLGSQEPPYYMVASLHFPTAEALEHVLTSTEMKAAGRDVRNFAAGGVTMFTQSEQSGLIP